MMTVLNSGHDECTSSHRGVGGRQMFAPSSHHGPASVSVRDFFSAAQTFREFKRNSNQSKPHGIGLLRCRPARNRPFIFPTPRGANKCWCLRGPGPVARHTHFSAGFRNIFLEAAPTPGASNLWDLSIGTGGSRTKKPARYSAQNIFFIARLVARRPPRRNFVAKFRMGG